MLRGTIAGACSQRATDSEMQKTRFFSRTPSLGQPNSTLVDTYNSWKVRSRTNLQFAHFLFNGKKHMKVRGIFVKHSSNFLGITGTSGLSSKGISRRKLRQCMKQGDVQSETSDVSLNSMVGQGDVQSETSGDSRSSSVESLPLRTEGLIFGPGQSDSWDSMEIGCPIVRRYLSDNEERWHMWYYGRRRGSQDSIGLAVSSNGIHWLRGTGYIETLDDVGIAMECSSDWWAFDTEIIRPSDILILSSTKVKASSGAYWMYYSGCNSDEINVPQMLLGNPERFGDTGVESSLFRSFPGLAISPDGRHWARIEGDHHNGALFDVGTDGEWDSLSVASPQVVLHNPDDLRMYYHSLDVRSGCFAVGIARSRDGVRWVKLGKILEGGLPGSFDELGITARHVISNRNAYGYLMIYEGVAADGTRSIGLAWSPDGLKKWKRCDNKPVFAPASSPNAWDNRGVGSPCLVQMDDNEWRLYYQGLDNEGKSGIGLAICTDGSLKSFRRWHGFHV